MEWTRWRVILRRFVSWSLNVNCINDPYLFTSKTRIVETQALGKCVLSGISNLVKQLLVAFLCCVCDFWIVFIFNVLESNRIKQLINKERTDGMSFQGLFVCLYVLWMLGGSENNRVINTPLLVIIWVSDNIWWYYLWCKIITKASPAWIPLMLSKRSKRHSPTKLW